MSTEEKMNLDERRKYLRRMKKRYVQAGRQEQRHLLDEMEAVTELHRKSLIRLMNGSLERKPRQRQRGRTLRQAQGRLYGPQVEYALSVIAESSNYICAERLTPNLVWMANQLAAHHELEVSPPLLEKLDQISISTVPRILGRIPRDKPRLPRQGPQPTRKLTQGIPMRRIPWNEQQPGYLETGLVHHCGPSACGEYVCTIYRIPLAMSNTNAQEVFDVPFNPAQGVVDTSGDLGLGVVEEELPDDRTMMGDEGASTVYVARVTIVSPSACSSRIYWPTVLRSAKSSRERSS